jgi:hypothetical protein
VVKCQSVKLDDLELDSIANDVDIGDHGISKILHGGSESTGALRNKDGIGHRSFSWRRLTLDHLSPEKKEN